MRKVFAILCLSLLWGTKDSAFAQQVLDATVPPVLLPAVAKPLGTFETPVSALVFDPRVDVQGRLFNEAQSDVSIRGGTFESTGFVLGAATLLDPQTGHYYAEIPVPSPMLLQPNILTGSANSLVSFNSTAGSIRYGWSPVRVGGEVLVGFSEYNGNSQEATGGIGLFTDKYSGKWFAEGNLARSASDGDLENSDHRFNRYAGRIQRQSDQTQTDLFAGYQSKFFGLQNLYAAPFDSFESEDLDTLLVMANHSYHPSEEEYLEMSAYYRKNRDDYDFDRFNPGSGNPFQHTTEVGGFAVNGRKPMGPFGLRYNGQIYEDSIESTSLTFGPFSSRTYWKGSLAADHTWETKFGDLTGLLGGIWEDDNRASGVILPVSRIVLEQSKETGRSWSLYADFSGASQVPGYTAIGSSPNGGLFRGNPDLEREVSYAFELGGGTVQGPFALDLTGFVRRDKDLTDWTFKSDGGVARSANPIDLWVYGIELIGRYQWDSGNVSLGYAYLSKEEDYGSTDVDASFYALNYPENRVTLALNWDLLSWVGIQFDTEWRENRENLLRNSDRSAWLTDAAVRFQTERLPGAALWIGVGNLWNEDFEEVPGVPRSGSIWYTNLTYTF